MSSNASPRPESASGGANADSGAGAADESSSSARGTHGGKPRGRTPRGPAKSRGTRRRTPRAAGRLSIGEVVALLRTEFSDLTDSKIRFLEDRKLISPERTPSGYRSFGSHDIEVLRWILTRQRDQYLPLSIIGERLERGEHLADIWGIGTREAAVAAHTTVAGHRSDAQPHDAASAPVPTQTAAGEQPGEQPGEQLRSAEEDPEGSAARIAEHHAGAALGTAPPEEKRSETDTRDSGTGGSGTAGSGVAGSSDAGSGTASMSATDSDSPEREIVAAGPHGAGTELHGVESATVQPGETLSQPIWVASDPNDGRTYTAAELGAASGLSLDGIRELVEFGLLRKLGEDPDAPNAARPTPVAVAGSEGEIAGQTEMLPEPAEPRYDSGALLMARIAREFSNYGLGARHLRVVRNAAARDAEMFEQGVQPVLHVSGEPAVVQRSLERLVALCERLRAHVMSDALAQYWR